MKKFYFNFLFVIVFYFGSTALISSQNPKTYAHNSLAEKIYLQLDNDVYTTDKTIWFKAIILNATSHNTNHSSGVLNVDLINSESEIIDSKLIKIKEGIGNGYFDLNSNFKAGTYLIRGYTEWNKNFDSDFIFETYVQVFSEAESETPKNVIQNVRIMDSLEDSYRILADVFPSLIGDNQSHNLKMIISENGKRDTIAIKKINDNKYVLDYNLPKTSKLITLEIEADGNIQYTTAFSPNNDYLDLQFFPEGGKLLNGLPTKIGFKAIGADGKAVEVEGEIMDSSNEFITSFKSNSLGMGSFIIDNPEVSKNYKAKVNYGSKKLQTELALPKVQASGYSLSVIENHDMIFVRVSHTDQKESTLVLEGVSRGYQYYKKEASLIDGKFIYVIPKIAFPDGVIAFKLIDSNQPMAERLYFNRRHDSRIQIEAELEKQTYTQREKIALAMRLSNLDSIPIKAHVSILGVESKSKSAEPNSKENILSYFLLSSDLKGRIEQPGYYFELGHEKELDYLMLTQGWTNYKYTKPPRNLDYKLEKGLSVSGVINKKTKIKKDKLDVVLMTFDESRTVYSKKIDVPSNFDFELDDMYGLEQDITIQGAQNWDKEYKNYNIAITEKPPLKVNFDYSKRQIIDDSTITKVITKNRSQKKQKDIAYFNTYGATELDEILINGYKMTPKREKVFKRYGPPEIVIDGKDIADKAEKFYSSGLYSTLLSFFPQIKIDQDDTGLLSARVIGLTTLFIVDGIPVKPVFYPQLQYIVPDQITSVEVIETASNYANLYKIVFPGAHEAEVPKYGGIISIYTKKGIGLAGAVGFPDKIMTYEKIPVFDIEKEFYSPKHDSNSYYDLNTPDLRGPIYWNPSITTDNEGRASIDFYHSDDLGDFQLIIETVSKNGLLGYKMLNYSVEKK